MSLTHTTISCCHEGCYGVITMHPDDEARLRRTHEWFYCPAGHSMRFTGKTAAQKRIEALERDLKRWQGWYEDELASANEDRERMSGLARAMQVCPLGCGWHGARRFNAWAHDEARDGRFLDRVGFDLVDHLVREHGLQVKFEDGKMVAP